MHIVVEMAEEELKKLNAPDSQAPQGSPSIIALFINVSRMLICILPHGMEQSAQGQDF